MLNTYPMDAASTIIKPKYARAASRWLIVCALMVALMVLVGGYTRLSGSGLSITQWKPIHGVFPPLTSEAWEEEFSQYRASPQFIKVNSDMTMVEFKVIFWPEFLHRLLGRAVGAVFGLSMLYYALRGAFTWRGGVRLLAIFALGGLQGVVGWYMVKSGLVSDPHVSHLRLAAHLLLAFFLFAMLLWTALDANPPWRHEMVVRQTSGAAILALLCVQIALGAMLAGLHGGLIYNSFPLMNGQLAPPEALHAPFWNNIAAVQFAHRWLAVIIILSYGFWWFAARLYVMEGVFGAVLVALPLVAFLQGGLGVATLLLHVPLPLALAHQFTGLLLFALTVAALHGVNHAADSR